MSTLSLAKVEAFDPNTLKIYNWEDYIDEGDDKTASVIEDWKKNYKDRTGKTVNVVYDKFATNEIMLSTITTGKSTYDLICPSEYTIQKMIRLDLLEKFELEGQKYTDVKNYNLYGSKYLKDLFFSNNLASYAIPYMWGTLGFIYNPKYVSEEDVKHWEALYMEKYKNKATAKDSVRDTFVVGVFHSYYDELMDLKDKYQKGDITEKVYNQSIQTIMNGKTDDESLKVVKEDLLKMKKNLFGFEVDNGKNDIATGKIWLNFAWSGDAVYSLDVAEEEEKTILKYSVPEEGSNVWFDGWVMPKGANKALATDFVNYLCNPEIAARNMNTIGYTSSIAGDAIWEQINDWYGDSQGEEVDLSYLFEGTLSSQYLTDGKAIIKVGERDRQFDAQYPSYEVITRCGIMEDFGDRNDAVLSMWKDVKSGEFNVVFVVIGVVAVVGCVGGVVAYRKVKDSKKKKHHKK